MHRSFFCVFCTMAITAALTGSMVGCGGGQDVPEAVQSGQNPNGASTTQTGGAQATAKPAIPPNHVLVGNWKGSLIATPQQLAEMGFDDVSLELEFGAGGEMAMLASMSNAQGRDESSVIATWGIVKEEGNKFTIQSQETDDEIEEVVIEMIDTNTMVVNAKEGGQFKLSRFAPPSMPPAPQPGSVSSPAALQAQAPAAGLSPPPVSSQLPQSGQLSPPPVP